MAEKRSARALGCSKFAVLHDTFSSNLLAASVEIHPQEYKTNPIKTVDVINEAGPKQFAKVMSNSAEMDKSGSVWIRRPAAASTWHDERSQGFLLTILMNPPSSPDLIWPRKMKRKDGSQQVVNNDAKKRKKGNDSPY